MGSVRSENTICFDIAIMNKTVDKLGTLGHLMMKGLDKICLFDYLEH